MLGPCIFPVPPLIPSVTSPLTFLLSSLLDSQSMLLERLYFQDVRPYLLFLCLFGNPNISNARFLLRMTTKHHWSCHKYHNLVCYHFHRCIERSKARGPTNLCGGRRFYQNRVHCLPATALIHRLCNVTKEIDGRGSCCGCWQSFLGISCVFLLVKNSACLMNHKPWTDHWICFFAVWPTAGTFLNDRRPSSSASSVRQRSTSCRSCDCWIERKNGQGSRGGLVTDATAPFTFVSCVRVRLLLHRMLSAH